MSRQDGVLDYTHSSLPLLGDNISWLLDNEKPAIPLELRRVFY